MMMYLYSRENYVIVTIHEIQFLQFSRAVFNGISDYTTDKTCELNIDLEFFALVSDTILRSNKNSGGFAGNHAQ